MTDKDLYIINDCITKLVNEHDGAIINIPVFT